MSNTIDKSFLIPKPIVFVEKKYYKTGRKARIYRSLFIIFNILTMLATFTILILSTLVFSKIIIKTTPDWYFYVTTMISAFVTFITSLINFFYIKDKYEENQRLHHFIRGEIIKYQSGAEAYKKSKNKDFEIFHRVNLEMGNKIAKEVNDERS